MIPWSVIGSSLHYTHTNPSFARQELFTCRYSARLLEASAPPGMSMSPFVFEGIFRAPVSTIFASWTNSSSDVDVVEEPVDKDRFQREIDRDRVLAF
jgi:hypothetical protein